jgi:hypothetical protein
MNSHFGPNFLDAVAAGAEASASAKYSNNAKAAAASLLSESKVRLGPWRAFCR